MKKLLLTKKFLPCLLSVACQFKTFLFTMEEKLNTERILQWLELPGKEIFRACRYFISSWDTVRSYFVCWLGAAHIQNDHFSFYAFF